MKENFRQSETERICLQQTRSKSKTKRSSSGRRKVIINRTEMKGGMKSNGKCKYVSRSKMEHDIRFKAPKKISEKKRDLTLPPIRSYKTSIIKAVWYWLKGRQIEQLKRTESPETDPHYIYSFNL